MPIVSICLNKYSVWRWVAKGTQCNIASVGLFLYLEHDILSLKVTLGVAWINSLSLLEACGFYIKYLPVYMPSQQHINRPFKGFLFTIILLTNSTVVLFYLNVYFELFFFPHMYSTPWNLYLEVKITNTHYGEWSMSMPHEFNIYIYKQKCLNKSFIGALNVNL